jgi:hypothetical protein
MQRQNTEPLGENTVKHEQSGCKSLKRKGPCARCFSRPKNEGHVPDAFSATDIPTAAYVRRKNPRRAGRSLRSSANHFHVPYDHLPPLWTNLIVKLNWSLHFGTIELDRLIMLGNNAMFSPDKFWVWNVINNLST